MTPNYSSQSELPNPNGSGRFMETAGIEPAEGNAQTCAHRWELADRAAPLACAACGVTWPGDPDWPPPYVCRVEGNHLDELIRDDIWSAARLIRELRAEFGP